MKVTITTKYRNELFGGANNIQHVKNELQPIRTVIKEIVDLIPKTTKTEVIDGGIEIVRDSVIFTMINYNNKKIVIETEYFEVGVACSSYLKSNGINCSIDISVRIDFDKAIEEIVEITPYIMPDTMICKKLYDIEDNETNIYYTDFDFKFNDSFFQDKSVTPEMFEDALTECSFFYSDRNSKKSVSARVEKRDTQSIKFTKFGFKRLSQIIRNYKRLFNTPYENIVEAL